jgi:hypothetical protein
VMFGHQKAHKSIGDAEFLGLCCWTPLLGIVRFLAFLQALKIYFDQCSTVFNKVYSL